jgi:hypothetical protein
MKIKSDSLVATCVLLSLFARYADTERFPISAYINIGITNLLSLSSIGLLAIDLAYTLKIRDNTTPSDELEIDAAVLWNVVYWGSLLFGSVFSAFLT